MADTATKDTLDKIGYVVEDLRRAYDQAMGELTKYQQQASDTTERLEKIQSDYAALDQKYDQLQRVQQQSKTRSGIGVPRVPVGAVADLLSLRPAGAPLISFDSLEALRRQDEEERTAYLQRSLTGASDLTGGSLSAMEFIDDILVAAQEVAVIRGRATIQPVSGASADVPVISRPAVSWTGKGASIPDASVTTGSVMAKVQEAVCRLPIRRALLDDTPGNLAQTLSQLMGEGIAAEEDRVFMVGDGALEPYGILTHADVLDNAVVSGSATTLGTTLDKVQALVHGLNPVYLADATFMMSRATQLLLAAMKDTTGQYLWQPNNREPRVSTLFGFEVLNPNGMPAVGAGAYPIVFGSLSRGYTILDRMAMEISRNDQERQQFSEVTFYATKRVGGTVTLAEAFIPLKVSA